MFFLLIILVFIFIFTGVVYAIYRLVQPFRYRAAVRAWLIGFYLEIFILMFIPKNSHILHMRTLRKYGGYMYLIDFTAGLRRTVVSLLRGQNLDEMLLLILPLAPALLAFLYSRRYPPTLDSP